MAAPDAAPWTHALEPETIARYRAKLLTVPGDDCLWWVGAISSHSAHGRFWIGPHRVVIAHRFAYALAAGPKAATDIPLLAHRCDNPLCQRVDPAHITPSTPLLNRREWSARRFMIGSPLGDSRGAWQRAKTLRDLGRRDPQLLAAELARLRRRTGHQPPLWE